MPTGTKDVIVTQAQSVGADPNLVLAIAKTENDFHSKPSPTGVLGMFQVTQDSWPLNVPVYGNIPYSRDPNSQAQSTQAQALAGSVIIKGLQDRYHDARLVAVGFNGGQAVADHVQTYMKAGADFSTAVNRAVQDKYIQKAGEEPSNLSPAKQKEILNYTPKVLANGDYSNEDVPLGGAAAAAQKPATSINEVNPTDIVQFSGMDITDADFKALTPEFQIDAGLEQVAWFDNPNLLTANPKTRSLVTPVTFQIYLSQRPSSSLHVPNSNKPIVLQLNAGIKNDEKQMSHLVNYTPSRTGMHVTLWGMKADVITASATTGLFMNQFGVTNFLSVADYSGAVKDKVVDFFLRASRGRTKEDLQKTLDALGQDALRVAAQDAFQEFLSLFRNNGITYFHTDNYTGTLSGREQVSPTGFSPVFGASGVQKNARNNDVLSKGYVVYTIKNTTYLGYFKSLSWEMDADKPFQWTFNFTFQVERELSIVPYPQISQTAALTPALSAGQNFDGTEEML